ncbi:hypothetical protein ITI46_29890 [Streptomyces oryzae]|uniref:Uncharacterized protein n=1 Tax=Streptomyces oryzae TaxID=1434886 RepID=A0ABS3XKD2_9ACTN|nr:hypothetical protein [Streptomyces oryzae]MBO8195829.1 hypothetical protein [Streptomyces oryzae]
MQLFRLRHRQHQGGKGDVLPVADDLKRYGKVPIRLTAQAAPWDRLDLPPL